MNTVARKKDEPLFPFDRLARGNTFNINAMSEQLANKNTTACLSDLSPL